MTGKLTPEGLAAFRAGTLRGLAIATQCIGEYMETFPLDEETIIHVTAMRDGISQAINMLDVMHNPTVQN